MADVLSRREENGECRAVSVLVPDWIKEVSRSYEGTSWAQELMTSLAAGGDEQKGYTLRAGLLRYRGRMVIGEDPELQTRILQALHASPIGGHAGLNVTYNKVRQLFYWVGMKKEVAAYVLACSVCQKCKHEQVPYPGLLQPLEILDQAWQRISMDFVKGLP